MCKIELYYSALSQPSRAVKALLLIGNLDFIQKIAVEDTQSYLYNSGFACGGTAVGDVNGDGRPDVFFVSGQGDNALYFNEGGMKFKKAGAGASVLEDSWVWGC